MLKSTFKKVSAIAIAGTMLAGMMAVPANAMTAVPKTEKVTTTAISDKFNSYTANTYTGNITATPQAFSENSRIQYSNYNTSGGYPGARTLTVAEREDISDDKYMKFDTWVGLNLNIDADKTYTVNPGDVVNIKFKYNYSVAKNMKIHVNLNNDDTRYQGKEGGTNEGAMWWQVGAKDYVANQGRIATIAPTAAAISDNLFGAISSPAATWNEMEITINTQDSDYNNQQTLTVKIGENYLKGLFDANYDGSGDETWDLLSEINSIQFLSYMMNGANDGDYFAIDDLSITVTGDRVIDYEYVSDLSNVVLDENFDNFSGSVTTNGTLTGTKFTMSTPGWATNGTDFTVTSVDGAAKTSATKTASTDLVADFDDVDLGADEAIHFSFDITKKAGVLASIGSTSLASPKIYLTTLDGKRTSNLTGDTANVKMHYIDGGRIRPGRLQTLTDAMMLDGYTYHFEYTIVPSNPAHGNKQTLTVKVTSPDNALTHSWQTTDRFSQYKETFYMDADRDTDGEQKFDSLSRFYFTNYYTTPDGTIDNVKVEVIKPGFEVKDVDNQSNTYTFSDTTPIELNYVTNASAASKVIVAQYADGGRLIKAEPADVAASGRGTVTVTPVANANMIKLMVLDMSTAIPYAKVFKLTKSN